MMKSALDDHSRLVKAGAAWLKRNGFGVVATELYSTATAERPDVLGFRSMCSAVIEAKISRADFLRDAKKPHRKDGGLGLYRFYLCPSDLITPRELPDRWGLLYLKGRSVTMICGPRGNMWPGPRAAYDESFAASATDWMCQWEKFQHRVDMHAELATLYSIARHLGEKNVAG